MLWQAYRAAQVASEKQKIILFGLISTIIGYLIQAFFNISVVTVAPIYWSLLGITYGLATHYLLAEEPAIVAIPRKKAIIKNFDLSVIRRLLRSR
ncbi:hypothetical protein AM500_07100 [Bacillus sp. FJAT-18017]|nr:hypothetical protein AM500_07100 [Bacillus sp. FJAT-18017]